MNDPTQPFGPVRRCQTVQQPREGRFSHHTHNLWRNLEQNRILITDAGLVSYRLAHEILQEPVLAAFVASGDAAMFVDPETAQRLYAFVDRA